MRTLCILITALFISYYSLYAQDYDHEHNKEEKKKLDTLFIQEVEIPKEKGLSDKVLHAEPLYIDLIRDLGARKGEHEWNLGFGLFDNIHYDRYSTLVEYEFAPINRLGLEIEIPFSFYLPLNVDTGNIPKSKINSLKLATQYTFLVSEKSKTSLAIGYLHDFEFISFSEYGKKNFYKGNIYNPFFIAAKRWGNNFHTLLYTGPMFEHIFDDKKWSSEFHINTNVHYMISGTRNFIGIEINKLIYGKQLDMVLRPQMRLGIAHNFLIGIVTGIPINRENERFSTFFRLIYEPKRKAKSNH